MVDAGYLLNRRYANNFTQALLGTGLGAFFIAVLVTHLYFHAINDIVAFALLAVCTAGTLVVSDVAWVTAKLVYVARHVPERWPFLESYRPIAAGIMATSLVLAIVAASVVLVRRRQRAGSTPAD